MTSGDRSDDSLSGVVARLRSLESSLLDAAVRRDRAKLRDMLTADFLEFGSSGRTWTRSTIIELLAIENGFVPPSIEDFQCALLSEDVALVTYRTVRTDPKTGEVVANLRSSIWIKDGGAWRMRFHQGTRTAL